MKIYYNSEELNLTEQINPLGDLILSTNDICETNNKVHFCTEVNKNNEIVKTTLYNFNSNESMEIEKHIEIDSVNLHSMLTTLFAIYGAKEKSDDNIIEFAGIRLKVNQLVSKSDKLSWVIVLMNDANVEEVAS